MSFDEKLISAVQRKPILYDSSHIYYYDNKMKENAWKKISKNLNENTNVLKKRWTSLRDCFRKALIKRKIKHGQKTKPFTLWKYEEQMSFLKAHFSDNRPHKSHLLGDSDNSNREESESEDYDGNQENKYVNQDLVSEVIVPQMENQSRPQSSSSSQGGQTPKIPVHSMPRIVVKTPKRSETKAAQVHHTNLNGKKEKKQMISFPSDHLRSFFKAMEDTVRTFSPILQVEVKSQISSLVSEYELKNLTSASYDTYECPTLPSYSTYFARAQLLSPSTSPAQSYYEASQISSQHSSVPDCQLMLLPTNDIPERKVGEQENLTQDYSSNDNLT